MAVVGDLDLDEALGPLLDPLGASAIPPAADPTRRWLRLAAILAQIGGEARAGRPRAPRAAAPRRRCGPAMDRLAVEGIAPETCRKMCALVGEQAEHWKGSLPAHRAGALARGTAARGQVDPPVRRNMLFDHAARSWRPIRRRIPSSRRASPAPARWRGCCGWWPIAARGGGAARSRSGAGR
jgi:ATP-dependent helicase/nuclease subunit B